MRGAAEAASIMPGRGEAAVECKRGRARRALTQNCATCCSDTCLSQAPSSSCGSQAQPDTQATWARPMPR